MFVIVLNFKITDKITKYEKSSKFFKEYWTTLVKKISLVLYTFNIY